jgi:hypothetical protein
LSGFFHSSSSFAARSARRIIITHLVTDPSLGLLTARLDWDVRDCLPSFMTCVSSLLAGTGRTPPSRSAAIRSRCQRAAGSDHGLQAGARDSARVDHPVTKTRDRSIHRLAGLAWLGHSWTWRS